MSQSIAKPLLRLVLLFGLLGLHGCITYRHLPPGPVAAVPVPEVLHARTAKVAPPTNLQFLVDPNANQQLVNHAQAEAASWFAPAGAGAPDYEVEITHKERVASPGQVGGTFAMYLLSLGTLPFIMTNVETSELVVKSGGQAVYRDVQETRIRHALTVWTPFALFSGSMGRKEPTEALDYLMAAHRAALAQRVEQDRVAFAAAVQLGTQDALDGYLAANPQSFFRGEALRGMSMLAAHSRDPLVAHKTNLARYPDYARFIDGAQSLWFVGPVGMQVVDIGPALKKGTSPELLAAQIRAARQPYKVFTADELTWLKDKGIPDSVAAAMLDATTAANAAGPATVSVLPSAAATAVLLKGNAASATAAPAAVAAAPGQPAAKPTMGDVAAECAAKLAAIKACEQVPFPANLGCKAIARQKFDNPACAVIQ